MYSNKKIVAFFIFCLISVNLKSEITVPKYCASIRDAAYTQTWIEQGLKWRESTLNYMKTNPSKKNLDEYEEKINQYVKEWFERDLEEAYKADNAINAEYPNNNFPTFSRDQVALRKIGLLNAYANGGTITENKEYTYNRCREMINRLN